MFKAKKASSLLSQRSERASQSSNSENESENIPLGQWVQTPAISHQNNDEDLFVQPSQGPSLSFHQMRSQRIDRRRFLSQRSQMRYTMSQSQGQSTSKRIPKSYFESILMKLEVKCESDFYLLNCDVFRFQNRLADVLRGSEDFPANLPILVKDVETLLHNSDSDWRKLMTTIRFTMPFDGSKENPDYDTVVYESIHNSMLRLLLNNKELQRSILELLFDELRTRTKPENDNQLLNLALVLRQMQSVEFLQNSAYIFNEYFDILPQCNLKAREILIGALNDLVEGRRHNEAIVRIIELIPALDELFTTQNLETFATLSLDTPKLHLVRRKVIHYIKNGAPKFLLENLLTFMAKLNQDETETYYEVINDIRNCIQWDMIESEAKVKVYNLVKRTINRCPVTRKNWLKAILYVENARDHKIIDPIACFIIGKNEDESANIENFFKKRVREKLFTIDLMQKLVRNASEILPQYVTVMTDIFKACFCERNNNMSFFGAIGFRLLFKIRQGDQRYPLQQIISLACTPPNKMPFVDDIRTNALDLLLEIKRNLKEADGGFAQVEKILDRSCHLTIDQYRIVIKILCSLAYDGTGNDKIKEDLEILASKHVTHMYLRIKLQGIIIVFQLLNQTMWTENPADDSIQLSNESTSTISLSQIPIKSDFNNAKLLRLALKAAEENIDALMLFYDEFSVIFSARNKSMSYSLNTKFATWLHGEIVSNFLNTFVVDERPEKGQEIEMDYFFKINMPSDDESINPEAIKIGMNIGPLVLKNVSADTAVSASIQLMCPMFNALATMTYRRDKTSLEGINALLGCALVLPKNFYDEAKFLQEHGGLAIEMYFHVANWFRCVISAFVSQCDRSLRKKVLQRINQLINIEASIKFLLQKGSYDPPSTTFQVREDFQFLKPVGVAKRARKNAVSDDDNEEDDPKNLDKPGPSKKIRRAKKKQKTAVPANVITQFDEESMNINLDATTGNLPVRTQLNVQTPGTQAAGVVKHKAKYWFSYGPKEKYRQLDMDLMILLEEKLEIVYPVPETEVGNCLYLQELKFILADLISKTESIAGVKKFRSQQRTQNLVSSQAYIHDLIMSLKYVIGFKKQLTTFLRQKIDEMDSDDSASRFSDETNHAKICFGSCLHLLAALFSWPNFCMDDNHGMLRAAMNAIIEPSIFDEEGSVEDDVVIGELAEKTLDKIVSDESIVMDLRSGVHLLHLVKALAIFADKPGTVVRLAEKLLQREWFALDGTKESNTNANILLTEILKCYMRDMELPELEKVVDVFSKEMTTLKFRTDSMLSYPNFNRSNCTIFYRIVAATCEQAMKHCVATIVRTKDLLECWKKCFNVLHELLLVNEKNTISANTNTFLRYSHSIVKIFRTNGVKAMQKMVQRDQQTIQDLLRSMQKTTRFLHNLSCDTKAKSNSRLLKQVPKLRETMEKLVIEVKSCLAGNHALSGFFVANLYNKNVKGELLLSQIEEDLIDEDFDEAQIEDDIDSPENSDMEENHEEINTPSVISSRISKIFD